MAIDLAPGHKLGLVVENPVLLAGGSVGCGEALHAEVDLHALGAVVVGPLTLHSRAGSSMPRAAELAGGLLLETGAQNRGLEAMLKRYGPLWARLGPPVVVQVADSGAREVGRLCARLSEVEGVQGVELLLPRNADASLVRQLVEACHREGEVPVWVKLGPERATEQATAAVAAGANALVLCRPPLASLGAGREGALFGPAAFPLMLKILEQVRPLAGALPLIACGGIHGEADARRALDAGAVAIQLDSVLWVEPRLPSLLAQALG